MSKTPEPATPPGIHQRWKQQNPHGLVLLEETLCVGEWPEARHLVAYGTDADQLQESGIACRLSEKARVGVLDLPEYRLGILLWCQQRGWPLLVIGSGSPPVPPDPNDFAGEEPAHA